MNRTDRPLCDCHDHPMTRQRNPDGSYRWRCTRESQLKRLGKRATCADRGALEALAEQHPHMTSDELYAELQRQRQLARSGHLAPTS